MTDQDDLIQEEGWRGHFHMMPYIVLDMGLSHAAFRLYSAYKVAASENKPRISAARMCMTERQVTAADQELVDAGLIQIGEDGVFILDIWKVNDEYGRGKITIEEARERIRQESAT